MNGIAELKLVTAISDLPADAMRSIDLDGPKILLANDGGRVQAIGAICTHEHEDLAKGELEDGCVICAMHFARCSLEAGVVLEGPANQPEPMYELQVSDGMMRLWGEPRTGA